MSHKNLKSDETLYGVNVLVTTNLKKRHKSFVECEELVKQCETLIKSTTKEITLTNLALSKIRNHDLVRRIGCSMGYDFETGDDIKEVLDNDTESIDQDSNVYLSEMKGRDFIFKFVTKEEDFKDATKIYTLFCSLFTLRVFLFRQEQELRVRKASLKLSSD